jgi:hypothetical protein
VIGTATTATNATASHPPVRVTVRNAIESDRAYIMDSWRLGWRLSEECRRLNGGQYRAVFDDIVRYGVMGQPDTQFLVACSPADQSWIWGWLCFTPGPVPTIHYAVVRPHVESDVGGRRDLRRIGLFTRMCAAAGVRRELVYTFRPTERKDKTSKKPMGVEAGLLAAAKRDGITAVFLPVADQFLKPRRR